MKARTFRKGQQAAKESKRFYCHRVIQEKILGFRLIAIALLSLFKAVICLLKQTSLVFPTNTPVRFLIGEHIRWETVNSVG